MLRDATSLCNGILPKGRVSPLSRLVICALSLLTGCATSDKFPTAFHRPYSLPESLALDEPTVRSQDSSLPAPWTAPTIRTGSRRPDEVHAGHSALKTISQSDAPPATPGHTFVKPRAKLGRPILNSQFGPSPPIAGDANNAVPERSSIPVTSSPLTSSPQQTADAVNTPANADEPSSPWLSPQNTGWQSAPGVAPPWSRFTPSATSDGTNTRIDGGFRSMEQPSFAADPETAVPLMQGDTASATIADSVAGNSGDAQKAADDVTAIVPDEPTMLDRLRGLYNPRIDENTDKIKKQMRRWPDPFGLLKDRDDIPPVPATPEAALPVNELRTADTAEASELTGSELPDPAHTIQAFIADMEKQLAEWPRTPAGKPQQPEQWRKRQTDLRLLYMISGRSAEAVRVIEALPEAEQEFWQSLMLSMNRYRESVDGTSRPEQLTESLDHLRTAAKKLQPLSMLSVRRLMLCDRIDGFGNVVEFPTANFEPGQRILVYSELQNFQSELTDEGKYRSEFAAVIEFMREGDDEVLVTQRVPKMEDLCDVERTDYYQSYELTLPALEGKYRMRIRLRDQLSLQTAESQLEFTVRSRGAGL
jgi:hypothetical protein